MVSGVVVVLKGYCRCLPLLMSYSFGVWVWGLDPTVPRVQSARTLG